MTTPATRLITLIMLLQRQPNQKAAQLAEALGVSVRTLHRYFGMLEEIGIPIYSERGPHGGFSLARGYKLPPLVFTPQEAVAIYLGTSLVGQLWGVLYQEPAEGALAKLDNVLPEEQREETRWARRTLYATGIHRFDPQALSSTLETIRKGCHASHRIQITYHGSSKPEPTIREVDPYALVHRSGWWYLIGYCNLREDMRTFRLDRILDCEPLETSFQRPTDFDVHSYMRDSFQGEPIFHARLRFQPEAASIARANLPGWELQSEHSDGSLEGTMTGPGLEWLASMVLSFGTWVIALEPPELRELVRTMAQQTSALYED